VSKVAWQRAASQRRDPSAVGIFATCCKRRREPRLGESAVQRVRLAWAKETVFHMGRIAQTGGGELPAEMGTVGQWMR